MKPNEVKSGQILVATKIDRTGCGLTIIHEGSICKVAEEHRPEEWYIPVYKSIEREQDERETVVDVDCLRAANEEETAAYDRGVRNIVELERMETAS